jgi:hypothetical protein
MCLRLRSISSETLDFMKVRLIAQRVKQVS